MTFAAQRLSAAWSLVGHRLDEVERDLILATLAHTGGNRTWAARMLGISIRTMRNKLGVLREAGIDVDRIAVRNGDSLNFTSLRQGGADDPPRPPTGYSPCRNPSDTLLNPLRSQG